MPFRPTAPFLIASLIALGCAAGARASVLDLPPAPLADARLASMQSEPMTPAPAPAPTMHETSAYGGPGPAGAALRSLILPGWGQLATGHTTQAAIFGALEVATWTSYATFQRQGNLRQDSYFQTAQLYAGIDLEDQDEDARKLVGQYRSSDVYNQYVVMREAAYFYEDPVEQQQYIDSRSIQAADAWNWGDDFAAFERYRAQRRSSEQAYKNGQYALGFAVINRVVSAIAAARAAKSRQRDAEALGAAPGQPRASMAWSLAPGPGIVPDARVACVVRF
jgi:hypothetical protein